MEHKMNATYQELLSGLPNIPCQNNEFIELNKYAMCSMYGSHIMAIPYHLNAVDYDFFWGCMKIYDAFGINYFDRYLKFISGFYGDFSHGLENWNTYIVSGTDMRLHSDPGEIAFSMYCEYLNELLACMNFLVLTAITI